MFPRTLPVLVVTLLAAPASADVTVFYPPAAAPAPLVAAVVEREAEPVPEPAPEPEARPEASAISVPVAERVVSAAAPEPAPVPEPTPVLGPAPVVTESLVTEISAPCAAPPARPGLTRFIRVGDGTRDEVLLPLLDDEGNPDPVSLRELSVLSRPQSAERPSPADIEAHEGDLEWVATGLRRLHPGLLSRLAEIARRFPGRDIEIVSGYRPDARDTSRHLSGRALDLRVVSVEANELDAFVRAMPETGVGLYPTSDFIHVDVRSRSAHWIDVSGPGEPPRRPSATPSVTATSPAAPAREGRATPRRDPAPEPGEIDANAIAREITGALGDFDLDLSL